MTDLQDALDWVDSFPEPTNKMTVLANAARLVANPNYEAALASVFTRGGAGHLGQEWPVEMYPSDIQRAVDAALTPPEDTLD